MNCPTPAQVENWDENLKEQYLKLPETNIWNFPFGGKIELEVAR